MSKSKSPQGPEAAAVGVAAPAAEPARFVVTVTSPAARRRAGFAFGPSPVHLREDQLDEAVLAALKADPLLSIRPYEAPAI